MSPFALGLLRSLSAETWRSGAALARAADATPARVRQGLAELEACGVGIARARGHGYRLRDAFEPLDAAVVSALLGDQAQRLQLQVMASCASTNSELLQRARAGAPGGSALACEYQRAGRGRRGNQWLATVGGSLTFSLLWRLGDAARRPSGLSLAAGVAVARALAENGVDSARLKWPNDLVCAGSKLGGILVELQGDAAVVGVGVNLRLPPTLRAAVAQPVTDVAALTQAPPPRNRLLASMLAQLALVLDGFVEQGFAAFRAEWNARDAYRNCEVTLHLGDGGTVTGRAEGVDAEGALLLRSARGLERFVNGEISLRPNRA